MSRARRRARRLALVVAALACAAPAAAHAADPGRWVASAATRVDPSYFQGIASDGSGSLFFDGPFVGGYATDLALRESARNAALIPAGEPFNHIGDWTYDRAEGGRLILPLECYTPGAANGGNTCGRGALAVADPRTMTWRYRVSLDPADIAKAMWAEVSPDGALVWTQSARDLLAYATADVSEAHAGAAPPIRPVRRLAGAVPAALTQITGAAFGGGRMFVAGQTVAGRFAVFSIDTATGSARLEIERRWRAQESEGLDVVDALGGRLQWLVQPTAFGGTPTFGRHATVVSFVTRAEARLSVRVSPARLRAGKRRRVVVAVTHRFLGRTRPVAGALVVLGGRRARTRASGRAVLRVRPSRAGTLAGRVTKAGLAARLRVRVTR